MHVPLRPFLGRSGYFFFGGENLWSREKGKKPQGSTDLSHFGLGENWLIGKLYSTSASIYYLRPVLELFLFNSVSCVHRLATAATFSAQYPTKPRVFQSQQVNSLPLQPATSCLFPRLNFYLCEYPVGEAKILVSVALVVHSFIGHASIHNPTAAHVCSVQNAPEYNYVINLDLVQYIFVLIH